jgi:hypothetical protein
LIPRYLYAFISTHRRRFQSCGETGSRCLRLRDPAKRHGQRRRKQRNDDESLVRFLQHVQHCMESLAGSLLFYISRSTRAERSNQFANVQHHVRTIHHSWNYHTHHKLLPRLNISSSCLVLSLSKSSRPNNCTSGNKFWWLLFIKQCVCTYLSRERETERERDSPEKSFNSLSNYYYTIHIIVNLYIHASQSYY